MDLIAFDENNIKHMKAFQHFAYEAGHPQYLVKGKLDDFDFSFTEYLSDRVKLKPCFVEDPNGCSHELYSRIADKASFNLYYCTEDDQDGYDELAFIADGKLFFDAESNSVVFEPDLNTVKMV